MVAACRAMQRWQHWQERVESAFFFHESACDAKLRPALENGMGVCRSVHGAHHGATQSAAPRSPSLKRAASLTMADAEYAQDGPVAQKIAAVIPYYPFKGIPRFYDINGFTQRPEIFQLVIDVFVARYKEMGVTSIGGFDARGFVIGPPIALALKVPFFMLRKPGKQPNSVGFGLVQCRVRLARRHVHPRGHPLDKDDPSNKSTVVKSGDKVLLIDDLVATGGTLSAGIELVHGMGGTVVECACVVELKMFVDPPEGSGLPSRKKSWEAKGIGHVPVWGLVSEDILTLEGEKPPDYKDDGEEH